MIKNHAAAFAQKLSIRLSLIIGMLEEGWVEGVGSLTKRNHGKFIKNILMRVKLFLEHFLKY